MRTRIRNIARRTVNISSGSISATRTYCAGNTVAVPVNRASLTQVSSGRDERMVDGLGKGSSHPCIHRVFDYDYNDSLGTVAYAQNAGGWCVNSYSAPHSWYDGDIQYVRGQLGSGFAAGSGLPPNWTIDTSVDESTAVQQLIERSKQLKADVLLNLVEANQMWPAVTSLANALPKMAVHWWELRKVLRTASAAFLAWKFGISPVVSDIMKVAKGLDRIKADVKRHEDGDKNRFSMVIPCEATYADGTYVSSVENGHVTFKISRQGRHVASPSVRYVLVVQPKATYSTSFFKKADYAMSRFATSPASLAWELVPFSFVVDWFVDLRKALNSVDRMLGHSPYHVVSFTRSFSYHVAADHYIETFSPCNGSLLQSFRAGSAEYKVYERSLVSGGHLATWNPRFGKNQAAISAALITQMLLRIPGAMRF